MMHRINSQTKYLIKAQNGGEHTNSIKIVVKHSWNGYL